MNEECCSRFPLQICNTVLYMSDKSSYLLQNTWCPRKKYTELVRPSDEKSSLINCQLIKKCFSKVNLNIDISFVDTGDLRAEILLAKVKICLHVQTSALAF